MDAVKSASPLFAPISPTQTAIAVARAHNWKGLNELLEQTRTDNRTSPIEQARISDINTLIEELILASSILGKCS